MEEKVKRAEEEGEVEEGTKKMNRLLEYHIIHLLLTLRQLINE